MILLVYCARCGTKNTDDARVCTQCGDSLYFDEERTPRSKKKAQQGDLCYDLDESTGKRVFSRRGVVIVGGIILLWALNQLIDAWFPDDSAKVWSAVIFGLGLLIIIYALGWYGKDQDRS